jgi:hypothetical protein
MAACKRDEDLRRVANYARSELWLLPSSAGLKKTLGGLRIVGSKWSERLPAGDQEALKWLAGELFVGLSVQLLKEASEAYRQPEDVYFQDLNERLAEGLASYEAMQQVSKSVDKMLMAAVSDLGVDPSRAVKYLGSFAPQAPGYAEPLAELIQRLAASSGAAADLARLADANLSASVGSPKIDQRAFAVLDETSRLLRLTAAFVEHQARLPRALLDGLRADRPSPVAAEPEGAPDKGEAAAGPTLFG